MTKRDRNYLIVFLSITLLFVAYMFIKNTGVKAYRVIQHHTYNEDTLTEGKYNGSFEAYNVKFAEINFSLDNGKVKEFKIPTLIHAPWINVKTSIIDTITKKDTLDFDAISGATGTSLYVKAAIRDAIKNAESDTSITLKK